jgi:ubiquinone/menaquinone biosynthesis C-methylase UbiE
VAPLAKSTRLILDVGTGTGIWPGEMARLFPQAEVIGVDMDTALFRSDVPGNCYLRAGNVVTGLPFPDQLFGYTHQRLLTAAVTAANWPGVVRELVRVTRAGGWVELVEIDTQMQQVKHDETTKGPGETHCSFVLRFHPRNGYACSGGIERAGGTACAGPELRCKDGDHQGGAGKRACKAPFDACAQEYASDDV